jgi:hypothetical protein
LLSLLLSANARLPAMPAAALEADFEESIRAFEPMNFQLPN